jgi:hypothetical protein
MALRLHAAAGDECDHLVVDHPPGADSHGPRRDGCWQYRSGSFLRLFNLGHAQSHCRDHSAVTSAQGLDVHVHSRPHTHTLNASSLSTRDGHSTQLDQPSRDEWTCRPTRRNTRNWFIQSPMQRCSNCLGSFGRQGFQTFLLDVCTNKASEGGKSQRGAVPGLVSELLKTQEAYHSFVQLGAPMRLGSGRAPRMSQRTI